MRICSLASGSSGNATLIASDTTSILVDCGIAARTIVARLDGLGVSPHRIDGILISHAHTDHFRAAGTLHARFGIPVYVDPSAERALAIKGGHTSWPRVRDARPIPERIGDIEVTALDTSHGHAGRDGRTVAFVLRHGRRKVGVVTDLGKPSRRLLESLRDADAIVLEANYDEATIRRKLSDPAFARDRAYLSWVEGETGHLSNTQCAEILAEVVGTPSCHVFLGHLSENHVDPRQDNNHHRTAFRVVESTLLRELAFVPFLHRTYRSGLTEGRASSLVEV